MRAGLLDLYGFGFGVRPNTESKIIFPEKSLSVRTSVCLSICLSVCLFVCLSVCPVCPVPSPKKVAETENFAKESCQIYFKGDKKIFSHAAVLGRAKPSYVYSILELHFRDSSPRQS